MQLTLDQKDDRIMISIEELTEDELQNIYTGYHDEFEILISCNVLQKPI
jgi:hypothetical protein